MGSVPRGGAFRAVSVRCVPGLSVFAYAPSVCCFRATKRGIPPLSTCVHHCILGLPAMKAGLLLPGAAAFGSCFSFTDFLVPVLAQLRGHDQRTGVGPRPLSVATSFVALAGLCWTSLPAWALPRGRVIRVSLSPVKSPANMSRVLFRGVACGLWPLFTW